jgi:hypothetical protein
MKVLTSAILSMLFAVSAHAQQEPIKLGILLDTSSPLSVGFVDASLGDLIIPILGTKVPNMGIISKYLTRYPFRVLTYPYWVYWPRAEGY